MKKTQIFKLFLCVFCIAAVIFVFASCGEETGGKKASGYDGEIIDNLPTDLDFKGEQVNLFYWGSEFVDWELTSDGTTGDIVDKSINARNDTVEARLGVKMNYIKGEVPAEVFMPTVRDEITSGSTDYDLIAGVQCTAGPVAAAGVFLDLQDAKYIDYNQPYWSDDYNQALSVNSKRFMIGGDISLTTTGWASCMTFDLELFRSLFGSEDDFYQEVADGKWTLDRFAEKCKLCYSDLNGNGQKDASDRYGFGIGGTTSTIDQFNFSAGVTYSKRDENNVPVLDVKNERTIEFVEKFYNIVYNNEGVLHYTNDTAETVTDNMSSVFEGATLDSIKEKRGEENDFGVIPMPKLNDNQSKYHSWISDNTVVYSVPISEPADRVDMATAVLECMASETYRQCLPQYYEKALKSKYVRDSWSAKMLDLIHDGETTDFVVCYSLSLGEIGGMMRSIIGYGEPNIVSWYDAKSSMVETKLKELFEVFEENTDKPFVAETTTQPSSSELEDLDIADNQISSSWITLGSKYKKSGVLVSQDLSDKFAYVINDNNEIEVRSPDIKVCGGYYPTAAIESRETLPIKDLSVTFHIDDGFTFSTKGWASSFTVLWTDTVITSLSQYLESPGTNGLREIVPDETKGVSVGFIGSQAASGSVSDYLYIVLYDGEGTRPEIDNRIGYRFTNQINYDIAAPTTIEFKEDDTLGYVVVINGNEIRTGTRGSDLYDIDLNILKDIEEGYLTVGGESNEDTFCNFTLSKINGKDAGTYFD
ncbi:MAG: hypothetical protein PUB34_06795 [Clostridia bacterium]|nr:hypothetical protein [Clostridia bacterium]